MPDDKDVADGSTEDENTPLPTHMIGIVHEPQLQPIKTGEMKIAFAPQGDAPIDVGHNLVLHGYTGIPLESGPSWRRQKVVDTVRTVTVSEKGITTKTGTVKGWNTAYTNGFAVELMYAESIEYQDRVDSDGNPVLQPGEPKLDGNGDPVLDDEGDPVLQPGEPIRDEIKTSPGENLWRHISELYKISGDVEFEHVTWQ